MKTVTDAVRELGGDFEQACEMTSGAHLYYVQTNRKKSGYTYQALTHDGIVEDLYCGQYVCTRAEFEAEADRLGYPRVTLQPGDYVRCEDVSDNKEYQQIAKAFMAAGCFGFPVSPDNSAVIFGWSLAFNRYGWVDFDAHKNFTRQLTPAQVLNATNAKPDQAQVTDWHERGELPPVGTVCEAYYMHGATTRWRRVEILKHVNRECAVFCPDIYSLGWCNTFRPIRTDRERWVDAANAQTHVRKKIAGNLYDAMIDGTLPTPGENQ